MDAQEGNEVFMRAALAEARKALGHTSPNPAVGAVLVRRGKIIARGHHRGAGSPHAEVECLSKVGATVRADATLYVTLGPCSTAGRTPPCTDALVAAGVRRVVVGTSDVNPAHGGRGIELLRAAGVQVEAGVLAAECAALNEAFNKWIVTRRPFVIAKCGMTLDGHLTRPAAEPRWITSAAARRHANHFRAQVDAILVGAGTVRGDNPRLTVRGIRGARQPWRVVLSRSGRLSPASNLFTDRFAKRTIVFRKRDLAAVLDELGAREITSVLIEGGGDILGQALDARLIDKVHIYLGPLFTGGPVPAFAAAGVVATEAGARVRNVRYEKIASDIFVSGTLEYPNVSE
jgi:diaminohydroxyphosphoribosylaminopyrimidine deaminase/5-amino-6-(5-phosphoribosylamino)uracil reductase